MIKAPTSRTNRTSWWSTSLGKRIPIAMARSNAWCSYSGFDMFLGSGAGSFFLCLGVKIPNSFMFGAFRLGEVLVAIDGSLETKKTKGYSENGCNFQGCYGTRFEATTGSPVVVVFSHVKRRRVFFFSLCTVLVKLYWTCQECM